MCHLPPEPISVLLMESPHTQQGLEDLPRPTCVTASCLQPGDVLALVGNVAAARLTCSSIEVPSKYVGVHRPGM
jgi:hypothetical protein